MRLEARHVQFRNEFNHIHLKNEYKQKQHQLYGFCNTTTSHANYDIWIVACLIS